MKKFVTWYAEEIERQINAGVPAESIDVNPQGGHSIVKNTGGWLDSLGSGILVGKDILGFFKNIDLDNS